MIDNHPLVQQLTLSDPQWAATAARGTDVVVTAGAGTGKTRTLVARYLSLVADRTPLRQIVAVTFTRKAAREMRNRVRATMQKYLDNPELEPAERAWWQQQTNSLDAARIGTIHNLCGEILRAHPAEARLDPQFGVLDEGQSTLLRREAVEAALAWAANNPAAVTLFALLPENSLRQTLDGLLQNRLVVQETGLARPEATTPAELLARWQAAVEKWQAGALAALLARPAWASSVAILRHNAAADPNDRIEQQRRLALAAVESAAKTESPEASRVSAALIPDLAALAGINLTGGSAKAWPDGAAQLAEVKEALKELRRLWQEQKLLQLRPNPADEALAAATPALYALFDAAQRIYQTAKEERYTLDFDDLEARAIELLYGHAAIRAYWQSAVQALLVDEFQDINGRQLALFRLLCPDPGKLFIVGDAKQSIYRFRGADVAVFRREQAQVAAAGGAILSLNTSYRTHKALVTGMNGLLRPILGEPQPAAPPWVAPFDEPLVHYHDHPMAGLEAPYIELHLTVGSKREGALERAAQALVARLWELADRSALQGGTISPGDVAILCRSTSSFAAYEDALDQAGIPFLTVAGKGFYDRPEIRDLLNALQAIADPADDLALAGLLRSPACGLSDAALYRLSLARPAGASLWQTLPGEVAWEDAAEAACARRTVELIRTLNQQAGRAGVADVLKAFLDATHYRAALRHAGLNRAARNVDKLLADAHTSGLVSVGEFLEYVAGLRGAGSREGEARATADGAVQIMSVHAAKGLEFPIVVIGDANSFRNRGGEVLIDPDLGVLLPRKEGDDRAAAYQLARQLEDGKEAAELNRLLYVAATRAGQKLLINGCISLADSGRPGRLTGWLRQIAGVIGLDQCDLGHYDEAGDRPLLFDLRLGETEVALTVYEPRYPALPAARSLRPAPEPTGDFIPPPLLAPLPGQAASSPAPAERPQRVWQVVPAAGRPEAPAPAWVVGALVHEALALWRFPGPGFDGWLGARAREHGLADPALLGDAAAETRRLLQRFHQHPLHQEIETAERRWHELPYYLEHQGQLEQGVIDVLFVRAGRWTVVDFKSDHFQDAAGLERLLAATDYLAQARRYAAAVRQLAGQPPTILLCLLNGPDGVVVRPVDGQN